MNQGQVISRRACVRAPLITRGGMTINRAVSGGSGQQRIGHLLPLQAGTAICAPRAGRSLTVSLPLTKQIVAPASFRLTSRKGLLQ